MIAPPTDCFYLLRLEGEAAEVVANTLSVSTTNDIKEAVLISMDFNNDIQATVSLNSAIDVVRSQLTSTDLIEQEYTNPLFTPSTPEQLDSVFEGDIRSESVKFTGADGNPFTLKLIQISHDDREILKGSLSCRPFELPSYSEIMHEHANLRLN